MARCVYDRESGYVILPLYYSEITDSYMRVSDAQREYHFQDIILQCLLAGANVVFPSPCALASAT